MNDLRQTRNRNSTLLKVGSDMLVFALAYVVAFWSRVDAIGYSSEYGRTIWLGVPAVVLIKLLVFGYSGSYRRIWRYCGVDDLRALFQSAFISGLLISLLAFLVNNTLPVPRSIPMLDMAFTVLGAGALRLLVRLAHENPSERRIRLPLRLIRAGRQSTRHALVVGAGDAGETLVREALRSTRVPFSPVAFVDDNPAIHGNRIHGIPVLGGRERIQELVKELNIQDIVIAIPSARGAQVRAIVEQCSTTSARLSIVPELNQVVDGRIRLSDLRQVRVEDLLGREPAELDLGMISSYVRGKRVLITGAGGSIGGELCRQILQFGPAEIQLFGRGEHSIYEIHRELSESAGFTGLVRIIGDVINKRKLHGVFRTYRPEIVFHTGADKHVPLMEINPDEAVFNNIIGTKNVLEVSDEFRCERVVCISTDKAVRPSSVMGCCKRVAELLVGSGLYPHTVPIAVRFGNVLGSRGSVIPHFQRQIERGGPITLTDAEISRYFMTIPEAAGLVIQAGALGDRGDLFVLDMGSPVKIWDLAHNMIRLAGLEPGRDIEVEITGLREGEKLHEELFRGSEQPSPTEHPKISRVEPTSVDTGLLLESIEQLTVAAIEMSFSEIRTLLKRVVPEFRMAEEDQSVQVTATRQR